MPDTENEMPKSGEITEAALAGAAEIDVKAGDHAAAIPSHIILLAEYGARHAGQVLLADADLISQLDAEKVPYREATARERSLGGFPA